ncbi:NlpC/P60 family protein [Aliihoeflea sp. PC F10.4]
MMITERAARVSYLNGLIGKPYVAGEMGPTRFDCYGLARQLQRDFWGRALPRFQLPGETGRFAVASAIAAHPERERWAETADPVDGAIVVMARQDCGFHMGCWVDLDGGLVVHTIEQTGVVANSRFQLISPAQRWRLSFFVPEVGK